MLYSKYYFNSLNIDLNFLTIVELKKKFETLNNVINEVTKIGLTET